MPAKGAWKTDWDRKTNKQKNCVRPSGAVPVVNNLDFQAKAGPSVFNADVAAAGASLCVCLRRRVHISSVTLEHLKGSYKVEPGDGQSRDSYLKEHGVVTFLVINPKVGHVVL